MKRKKTKEEKKKAKKRRIIEEKKMAEKWKIWDKEEEAAKSKEEAKEIGASKISQVDSYLWEESKWEYVNEEVVRTYDRDKGEICRSFEPTVMFFGLTNSLAIMINEIIQDLINTREVASFINDVIVGIEGHNEVVEEVVKRLAENNLYIKLKKMQVKGWRSRVFRSSD